MTEAQLIRKTKQLVRLGFVFHRSDITQFVRDISEPSVSVTVRWQAVQRLPQNCKTKALELMRFADEHNVDESVLSDAAKAQLNACIKQDKADRKTAQDARNVQFSEIWQGMASHSS